MLKVLILLAVVVGLAMWFLKGRRLGGPPASKGATPGQSGKSGKPEKGPATMVACAHCGVHLPSPEASFDPEGRTYCGEAHRLAGPR